jgi:SAM-dependent methyltransferase
MDPPWEHPDWYDLHDTTWTAGPEREPEHYRELVLALPPLDAGDHLVDVGAGTGKLARLVARGYPELGRVTLVEPNPRKLERARASLAETLPRATVVALAAGLGEGAITVEPRATVAVVGSVLMPIMELRGGTLGDGLAWVRQGLSEIAAMLGPGGLLYALETLGAPWARGPVTGPVRRLQLPELVAQLEEAGFGAIECCYRFRDRAVVRGRVRAA